MSKFLFLGASLAISVSIVSAIDKTPAPSVPVQMIVTVEARRGRNIPALNREDFMVSQGRERFQVTDAIPLVRQNAGLELFVLIDDAANSTLDSQLGDLRHFIDMQPASTSIGIGYMQYGTVQTREALTKDHSSAARALRLPLGISSSPWLSLTELIKQWPDSGVRREVVMVTSGADALGGDGIVNPYLDAAIADAQRAGIVVCAIYTPAVGHAGHSYWRMNWDQNHLAELADETGGEAYMLGFGPPVSIAPYLANITERLTHQYRIALLVKAESKPKLFSVKLTTEAPNAEIVAASKMYVPADSAIHR